MSMQGHKIINSDLETKLIYELKFDAEDEKSLAIELAKLERYYLETKKSGFKFEYEDIKELIDALTVFKSYCKSQNSLDKIDALETELLDIRIQSPKLHK